MPPCAGIALLANNPFINSVVFKYWIISPPLRKFRSHPDPNVGDFSLINTYASGSNIDDPNPTK